MDEISKTLGDYYAGTFAEHGPTPKGVDWNDPAELNFRYRKMMAVLDHDFERPVGVARVLDVGCGWGGLLAYCRGRGMSVDYTGIDIVPSMIDHARKSFNQATFVEDDVFTHDFGQRFDYVVCNAILTQKLNVTIQEMEQFSDRLILRMFDLCSYGIAFNLMSNRVNYMVNNLYYRSPVELLNFCLTKVSPRVKLDHGYSSLKRNIGKYYDFTVYIFKD